MSEPHQRFDSFEQWVNKASSWLTRYDGKAICFDAAGRQCQIGRDFMRARDEEKFPVQWVWDWQVPALFQSADAVRSVKPFNWNDDEDPAQQAAWALLEQCVIGQVADDND